MKVWIFNNYAELPEYGQMTRSYNFGKYLKRFGHEPVVFVGSHPHNADVQLITGKEKFRQYENCEFPWVLIKNCDYGDSKIKRVFAMFQYCQNLYKAAKAYEKPVAIVGSSAHPFAAVMAILLGRKYHCKKIVEIRDLWPESIVAYGVATKNNPLVKLLYRLEKWLYTKADAVIFTMEGGKDYIVEQGWDTAHGGPVDLNKVYHINNGVDFEAFNYNKEHYSFTDPDFDDPDTFKVVYTGSIRKANNLGALLDIAKKFKNESVRFLIYGSGDYVPALQKCVQDENITNFILKGRVEKKYIPYINSKADLLVLNYEKHDIWKYGGSQNKLFEYFASGTPVMTNIYMGYDLIERYNAGIHVDYSEPEKTYSTIKEFLTGPKAEYEIYCANARRAAEDYDFAKLTDKLLKVIEEIR